VDDLLRAIKPAVFLGSSRRDLKAFPDEVRQDIGQALFEVQLGLHPKSAKPLKGLGAGFWNFATPLSGTHIGRSTPFDLREWSMSFTSSRRSQQAELRRRGGIWI